MSWSGPGRGGGGRGGRGSGGGDYGGRGRGSGDRGGRGGGRGGRGGPIEVRVFKDPHNPLSPPDPTITNIENKYAQSLTGPNALAKLSLTGNFPPRPGYGTRGTPITVYANYFKIKIPPNASIFRYNIEVAPIAVGKKLKRVIELLLEQPDFANVVAATEFKSLLITNKLLSIPDDHVFQFEYRADGEDEAGPRAVRYEVRLLTPTPLAVGELVTQLASMTATPISAPKLEIIQAMNALLGFYPHSSPDTSSLPTINKHFALNRKYFHPLGGGLEALRGYYQSVRAATGGLLVNANVAHNVFLSPGPLDRLLAQLGSGDKARLEKKLAKIRISVTHIVRKTKKGVVIPRIKSIHSLASPKDGQQDDHPPQVKFHGAGPKDVKFYLDDKPSPSGGPALPKKQYISVWDYFKKVYPKIQLKETNPVLNVGNRENPSYLPVEVCVVQPGQTIKRRLSPDQTAEMITFACRKPWENADSIITDGREVLGLNSPTRSVLAKFNLSISTGLVTVQARILPPPAVNYRADRNKAKTITPMGGSWNLANTKFHLCGNLGTWTYLLIRSNRQTRDPRYSPQDVQAAVESFSQYLQTSAGINAGGLVTDRPGLEIFLEDGQDESNDRKIQQAFRTYHGSPRRPKFVLVILPYNDKAIYDSVKTTGDTKAGMQTVCVLGPKFLKQQPQYFGNISMKFNLKAGGINQTLDPAKLGIISEGKTMVVGIDVTHPSPGSKDEAPSAAAIVASCDKFLGQWPCDYSVQEPRKEMVTSLLTLFLGRFKMWLKKNPSSKLPENVIVYRDGVSEGQYQSVLDIELPMIRAAARQMYPPEATKLGFPKISIIICGKRHHTRFYPTTSDDCDRSSNCKPGTVVDRVVTETRNWDFFLQPHACLQGTARSCHYFVALDEVFKGQKPKVPHQNTADTLEDLTHNMCYLFGRATKAVSLCPPAYYADLLCTRLRCYLASMFDPNELSATQSVTSSGSARSSLDIPMSQDTRESMFYV